VAELHENADVVSFESIRASEEVSDKIVVIDNFKLVEDLSTELLLEIKELESVGDAGETFVVVTSHEVDFNIEFAFEIGELESVDDDAVET